MLTRNVVIKLLVFAVIGVIAVVYTAMRYAGIGSGVLDPGYPVRLELATSGGLFTNSEVTYRGVTIGKVTGMSLTANGLEADLHIDSSAPKIPSDLTANVADRSAVGEQYVNLVPNTDAGPYLSSGSVIAQHDTTTPLPTENLLSNLDSLAKSVPTQALQTTVDELDNAFTGTGQPLQKLLDSVADFTSTAQDQLPQTTQLLDSSSTVLNTQYIEGGALNSFSNSLQSLSSELKNDDPAIRTLIQNVPPAATQVTYLLDETGPQLSSVIANLLTTANILVKRTSNLEEMMVAYPMTAAAAQTVASSDGTAHLGLVLNLFNPPPCTAGYQGTTKRAGNETAATAPNTNAYCAAGPGSATDVRGAQNAPYGGSSSVATSSDSGQAGQSDQQTPSAGSVVSGGDGLSATSLAQLLGVG
ncbi:MAG TPA: MlaD family protein [Pseudonocardiaceae bacterium]|jgi:phospholipid/cholesterol/gamma-HCH transport system substrate-binding protein|nr:MlaD family protein [Pseudonocardiaceae bacterium]